MQMLEHCARRQLEVARGQFVRQLFGIGRQVSERPELDPLIAGRGDLVEESGVRGLAGIVGKPHAPRVRGGSDKNCAH